MTTPLDEALAEARKTLALCDVLADPHAPQPPASARARAKWERIEAALLRAQRIEAAAVTLTRWDWGDALDEGARGDDVRDCVDGLEAAVKS